MIKQLFIIILSSIPLFATDYAVVVGIDKVKNNIVKSLVGAKNDARAYKNILLLGGLKEENIKLLLDKNATKGNIKKALQSVVDKIKNGDRFYYYHAGHGASLKAIKAEGYKELKDFEKTGILIPYDYKSISDVIITQRDLKPYFQKIDKKVSFALLVFDSCYAGFNYRGELLNKHLVSRYTPVECTTEEIKSIKSIKQNNSNDEYPYKNTYALMSSDSLNPSDENNEVKRGVFTMTLEKCIIEEGSITGSAIDECLNDLYVETTDTYTHVHRFITPKQKNTNMKFFNIKKTIKKYKIKLFSKIKLNSVQDMQEYIEFTKVSEPYDLMLSMEDGLYRLDSGSVLINRYKNLDSVKKYLSSYRLINIKDRNQLCNIDKVLNDIQFKEYVKVGDPIENIDIPSNKEEFTVEFSLGKSGKLYMFDPDDSLIATEPIGTEFLKIFIFDKKNTLDFVKTDTKTGEVLNAQEQIDRILNIIDKSSFCSVTKKIKTDIGD